MRPRSFSRQENTTFQRSGCRGYTSPRHSGRLPTMRKRLVRALARARPSQTTGRLRTKTYRSISPRSGSGSANEPGAGSILLDRGGERRSRPPLIRTNACQLGRSGHPGVRAWDKVSVAAPKTLARPLGASRHLIESKESVSRGSRPPRAARPGFPIQGTASPFSHRCEARPRPARDVPDNPQ